VLSLRAPEALQENGTWKYGTWSAQYHLCMVVRLLSSTSTCEYIRTYDKDGSELLQSEVGVLTEKAKYHAPWTIEDEGNYILFYFRLVRPEGWPGGSEMDVDRPEFAS